MDDSLSAVDTITESYILNSLRTIRKDKTTIIIAHRITTLETLDKIIVVEDGTVTNIGTHQELLVKSEAYKKEVALQELEKEVEGDLNER
jgi:ATP-binding cassette subfamily B protein